MAEKQTKSTFVQATCYFGYWPLEPRGTLAGCLAAHGFNLMGCV